MLFMEMGKEYSSAEGLTGQPRKVARWIDQDFIGQSFNGGEELLKYLMRFVQDFAHRAPVIGLIDPRIDFIVSLQVCRPGRGRFGFAALCSL